MFCVARFVCSLGHVAHPSASAEAVSPLATRGATLFLFRARDGVAMRVVQAPSWPVAGALVAQRSHALCIPPARRRGSARLAQA